jgi:hypothetical protein
MTMRSVPLGQRLVLAAEILRRRRVTVRVEEHAHRPPAPPWSPGRRSPSAVPAFRGLAMRAVTTVACRMPGKAGAHAASSRMFPDHGS